MMYMLVWIVTTFCSYFVKGLSGFANTLIFSSVLSFYAPNRVIAPVDLLLCFPANFYMAYRERKNISLRIVIPLVVLIYLGMLPGAFFLKTGNEQLLKIILGISIVLLGFEMMFRDRSIAKHGIKKANPVLLILIGLGSGILCGMFGVGAFLAAYINRTAENHKQFKANFCCVFFLENLMRILLYSRNGLLTFDSIKAFLLLLPIMVIAMKVGMAASNKIEEKKAKLIVQILLILTGLSLTATNIMQL